MNLPIFRLVAALFVMSGLVQAQLATSLQLSKLQYLSGEPIVATVSITNHAGRDIIFQGEAQRPWLDFVITNARGDSATPTGRSSFGTMKISAGQTLSHKVDLSTLFQLADSGTYSTSATVRMPGRDGETTTTNRVLLTVSPGRPYWTQKVGVGDRSGKTREFRILNFSGDQKTQLYAQVLDGRSGLPIRTFSLGEALLLRKPSVTIDKNQRMHVLFLASPDSWVHCQIDTDGQLANRAIHKCGPQGDPLLMTAPDGSVSVANSILYDPKAAAAARAKFRKLSERPSITF
ncbi:MAG: hypothetical protein DVB25_04070 [Verrucomicrobia bacterium]|nr:MAG: hypothetical protein DVB25_04070 [Verrucomicrobiota bacterium]